MFFFIVDLLKTFKEAKKLKSFKNMLKILLIAMDGLLHKLRIILEVFLSTLSNERTFCIHQILKNIFERFENLILIKNKTLLFLPFLFLLQGAESNHVKHRFELLFSGFTTKFEHIVFQTDNILKKEYTDTFLNNKFSKLCLML